VATSFLTAIAFKRLDLTPCPRFSPRPLLLQIIKTASASRESKRDWHGQFTASRPLLSSTRLNAKPVLEAIICRRWSKGQTLHAGALQLLSVDETQISGLRSSEVLNLPRNTVCDPKQHASLLFPKEAEQTGTIEEMGLDVNPARGLHDRRPCSRLSRHSGREREPPL
jgi:hypothetical protein